MAPRPEQASRHGTLVPRFAHAGLDQGVDGLDDIEAQVHEHTADKSLPARKTLLSVINLGRSLSSVEQLLEQRPRGGGRLIRLTVRLPVLAYPSAVFEERAAIAKAAEYAALLVASGTAPR